MLRFRVHLKRWVFVRTYFSPSERFFTSVEFKLNNQAKLAKLPPINLDQKLQLPSLVLQLAEIQCQLPFPSTYYPLGATTTILKNMNHFAHLLQNNRFLDESGTSSRLYIGEKGIGKSVALKSGLCGISVLYPDIVTVYVEYFPAMKSLGPLMAQALSMPNYKEVSVDECLQELWERKKRLFLVVDDVDHIYTSTNLLTDRLRILDELQLLGSQTSGLICVFLCGSASVTQSLINRKALHDPATLLQYPLLTGCPDLNDTKYRTIRLFAHSTAKSDIQQIIMSHKLSKELAEVHSNSFYFLCGGNTRLCNQLCKALLLNAKFPDRKILSEFIVQIKATMTPVLTSAEDELYTLLMNAMVKKNLHLFQTDYKSLHAVDWFSLEPLAQNEAHDICMDKKMDNFYFTVLRLVDHGLLSVSYGYEDAYLYPATPLLLYRAYIDCTITCTMRNI